MSVAARLPGDGGICAVRIKQPEASCDHVWHDLSCPDLIPVAALGNVLLRQLRRSERPAENSENLSSSPNLLHPTSTTVDRRG